MQRFPLKYAKYLDVTLVNLYIDKNVKKLYLYKLILDLCLFNSLQSLEQQRRNLTNRGVAAGSHFRHEPTHIYFSQFFLLNNNDDVICRSRQISLIIKCNWYTQIENINVTTA